MRVLRVPISQVTAMEFRLPVRSPGVSINADERDRLSLIVCRGHKNSLAPHAGRGMTSSGNWNLPRDVLADRPTERRVAVGSRIRAAGPSPTRPVFRTGLRIDEYKIDRLIRASNLAHAGVAREQDRNDNAQQQGCDVASVPEGVRVQEWHRVEYWSDGERVKTHGVAPRVCSRSGLQRAFKKLAVDRAGGLKFGVRTRGDCAASIKYHDARDVFQQRG